MFSLLGKQSKKATISVVDVELTEDMLRGATKVSISFNQSTLDRYSSGDWMGKDYVLTPDVVIIREGEGEVYV
ncbi:MAG: hypothetical protein DRQ89_14095 [Epsilonproteobacteria bacterium]|nr:MAG: hypothetical protein DRQ89_14095 [Campylobacterota bacterium]